MSWRVAGGLAVVSLMVGSAGTSGAGEHAAHEVRAARELRWGDAPAALPRGAKLAVIQGDPSAAGEVVTVRLWMPEGYTMGDTIDRSAAKVLGPGGWGLMPAGEHHYAFTTAETIVQVHMIGPFAITYVNPEDDPQARAAHK